MHGCTGLYTAIQSYTGLYTAIKGYTQLYRAINNLAELYTAIQGYTQLLLQGYILLFRPIHKYTGPHTA